MIRILIALNVKCFISDFRMTSCSFITSAGGSGITCGPNIKVRENLVVPLGTCCRPINSHLAYFHINLQTIRTEGELIKIRGGLFQEDVSTLTVCPNHRQKLGIGWSCRRQCALSYCPGYKTLTKGTISTDQSEYLLLVEKKFAPVGSGKEWNAEFLKTVWSVLLSNEQAFWKKVLQKQYKSPTGQNIF